MFAGIVEGVGRVVSLRPLEGRATAALRLEVDAGGLLGDVAHGGSVAVNGVGLTMGERTSAARIGFDVIPETLQRSNLGRLTPGSLVNLERSLRVGDRIDGHFVQGHVDGVAAVEQVAHAGGEWRVWVASPEPLRPYIIPKGSIAIDGVSLTIAEAEPQRFSVALIPTTLERTNLVERRAGDLLNLESDFIVRAIVARLDGLLAAGGFERTLPDLARCVAASTAL